MSDQPLGPGWWRASDGKWYPPAGPGVQQPVYAPQPDRLQRAAYSSVVGCILGVSIFVLLFFGLIAIGLAAGK